MPLKVELWKKYNENRLLFGEMAPKDVASILNCDYRTIQNIRNHGGEEKYLQLQNQINQNYKIVCYQDQIEWILENNDIFSISHLRQQYNFHFGIDLDISDSTILKFFEQNKIKKKYKIYTHKFQFNTLDKIYNFYQFQSFKLQAQAYQFIFQDECLIAEIQGKAKIWCKSSKHAFSKKSKREKHIVSLQFADWTSINHLYTRFILVLEMEFCIVNLWLQLRSISHLEAQFSLMVVHFILMKHRNLFTNIIKHLESTQNNCRHFHQPKILLNLFGFYLKKLLLLLPFLSARKK